jgi:hypothetical protein
VLELGRVVIATFAGSVEEKYERIDFSGAIHRYLITVPSGAFRSSASGVAQRVLVIMRVDIRSSRMP